MMLTTRIQVACPKCDNDRAKYRLIQIRSADEPMTRCTLLLQIYLAIIAVTDITNVTVYRFARPLFGKTHSVLISSKQMY